MASENGWEPGWVGTSELEWSKVPGTNVTMQFRKGWPLQIMRAYAADYNEFIEPLRDADSACYTPTNSVSTSNHLNGTAMDLNWDSHPFRVADAGFDQAKIARMRDLLEFYEDTIFWANDWNTPKDAMHHQMGYDTYNNPRVGDFIHRKIRGDGYSTYKRGPLQNTTVVASVVNADAVSVLSDVMGASLSKDRYAALLPAVSQCLRDCECTTVDRIAMWCAQVGHESGGLQWMQEIASGDAYEGRGDLGNTQPGDGRRFKGHGPIQVTGRHNHTELSKWAFGKGLVPSPTFFVDNPDELASDKYGFIGVTWYWTTQRDMNGASDRKDIQTATRYVNGGLNGLQDRTARYNKALGMGDRLLSLVQSAPAQASPPAAQPPAQSAPRPVNPDSLESRSGYRTPGEGPIGNITVVELNQDAMLHQLFVEWSAITLGDTESIYRVIRSAAGKGAVTDHSFIVRARAVLDRVPQDDLRRVLAKVEIVEPDLLKALIAQGKIV